MRGYVGPLGATTPVGRSVQLARRVFAARLKAGDPLKDLLPQLARIAACEEIVRRLGEPDRITITNRHSCD